MTKNTRLPKFNEDPEYRQNCIDCLMQVKQVLDSFGVEFWLDYGTLLGSVRHGDLIPNDDDIDIAVRAEDMTPEVMNAFVERGFQLFPWQYKDATAARFFDKPRADRLGWLGVRHASLAAHRAWLDIFFYFEGPGVLFPGRSRFYPKANHKGAWEQPAHLVAKLVEVPFLGSTFKVPADAAAYLANLYGPTWQTPQEFGTYGYGNFIDFDASLPAKTADGQYACKVSVVLPTYNHLDFLPKAISTILGQSLLEFELIVVNDGSTDGTQEYLATLTDPRIKVINRPNGGLPSALNCGFAQARGDYYTWTSADNVVTPSWLEELAASLDAAPPTVGFVSSGFALMDEQERVLGLRQGQRLTLDRLTSKNVGITSFMYRAELAAQVGPYDEALNGAEDWDMWLRMFELSDALYVDKVLYFYRLHANSMTSTIPDKVARASVGALHKLRERHGGRFDLDRYYPRLREAKDQSAARWQARVKLSAALLDSPFCPPAWTAELIVEALRERFDPALHANLIFLLCRGGAWELASGSLDEVAAVLPAEQLERMRALVASRDPARLQEFVVADIADDSLLFPLGRA